MQTLTFAIPGDIDTKTGGYIYDRRVVEELRNVGVTVHLCTLPATYPFPEDKDVASTIASLKAQPANVPLIIDGLAWGAVPNAAAATIGRDVVALCHHPLGFEAGLTPEQGEWFLVNEKQNLALASQIIVTSNTTARTLINDFAVPASKISVAIPGTDAAHRRRGSSGESVGLLAVGALIARKGYDVLLEALSDLLELNWTLNIAGSLQRSPHTASDLRKQIQAHGMQSRVTLLGELPDDALDEAYDRSDIFVLPSRYEGYGMVLAEAMARGLAIVTTTGGAAAATVPGDAAIKIPPDNSMALAQALRQIVSDADLCRQLSDASWAAGQALPRWSTTASIIADAILSPTGVIRP